MGIKLPVGIIPVGAGVFLVILIFQRFIPGDSRYNKGFWSPVGIVVDAES